ncbi:gliding motility protein GldM [Solitalea lacus]|uniref:type IX secretion system motor protein PorM/GldM n=1 Tax=Solitalea lacus TaxID=2911172 RepID=UPI001EDC3949|nr:gliding motility protein GldM [Solitalea lacus]UKJ07355.1 gliding motility protein GldM [Solitalea lacus]
MAGGKQTARQQMINLMYLVLTAMLALNVSAEVLNAFKTVRDGLDESTTNLDQTVNKTMEAFQNSMKTDPGKTGPWFTKAQEAVKVSNELGSYIKGIKDQIVKEADGINQETGDIAKNDDLDISTRIMLNEEKPSEAKGPELKAKINETREKLLSLIDPADKDRVSINLKAEDRKDKKWENAQFQEVPVTASVTILSKLEGDVKNSEVEILKYLQSKIYAEDFKFDKLDAVIVAPSSYVLAGQQYSAEVFLTASSSTMAPDVYVGGSKLPIDANGKAKYTVTASGVGERSFEAKISVKKGDGTVETYSKTAKYEVAAPSANVSADKMNVLYIGVENPVSISAAGVPNSKVRASLSGAGSLRGSNGKYIAEVTTPGQVTVNVSAEINGKMTNMGSQVYRVKQVPPPTPKFAGLSSGRVSSAAVKAQPGVFAVLENFDFDMKFNVTGYTMYVVKKRTDPIYESVNGPALSARLRQALSSVTTGDKITIEDITVRDPKGNSRRLSTGVSLTVQ